MSEGKREKEARKVLQEARLEDEKEKYAEERKELGECPLYYTHFDGASFTVGAVIGLGVGYLICVFLLKFT